MEGDDEPREAAMGDNDKHGATGPVTKGPKEHVVFDFTGLGRPDVSDLAWILTARLRSAPTDQVWVRSLPRETAHVLTVLRLDHLFRRYPKGSGRLH
jgi:hypothetical protein